MANVLQVSQLSVAYGKVEAVSQPQLQQQAMRWLNQDQMIIVVVGDAKRLEKPLKALNLPLYHYTVPGTTQG